MRALLRGSACLLITVLLAIAAAGARADELLVMPYTCSVGGGHVVLTPSPDEAHRILSRREQREFTACSPADPSTCRKWIVHRFDVDCGGERVPWPAVVAAAARDGGARLENGQFQIEMPNRWALSPGDPCAMRPDETRFGGRDFDCEDRRRYAPPAVVSMPHDFAPKFGIDAIFIPDDRPHGVRSPEPHYAGQPDTRQHDRPRVGSYARRGSNPDVYSDDYGGQEDVYAAAPDVYNGPRDRRYRASPEPESIPFKIAPPAEGLTVEREPAPEPEVAFVEPPPLPTRMDPSIRRELAEDYDDEDPSNAEQDLAQPPLMTDAPPVADQGSPVAPMVLNDQAVAAAPQTSSPVGSSSETAEAATEPELQTGEPANSVAPDGAPTGPSNLAASETPPAADSAHQEPAGPLADPREIEPGAAMDVASRLFRGEPAAVAGAVIGGGLLAILILGMTLKRRRESSLPDPAQRDISSISLGKGLDLGEPFAASGERLGSPTLSAPASRTHGLSVPTLSSLPGAPAGDDRTRPHQPTLQSVPSKGVPALDDTIPQTHAEALRVLGMGSARDASPASIKKVVESLRQSWNPEDAADEDDRRVRALMLKQVNAAWEILSGTGGPDVAADARKQEPQFNL